MMKTFLVIILGAILTVEILTFASINRRLDRQGQIQTRNAGQTYTTPGVAGLTKRFPEKLVFRTSPDIDQKPRQIETKTLVGGNQARVPVKTRGSLRQYFYEQTGTHHPWAAYAHRDMVRAPGFSREAIGKYLLSIADALNQDSEDAVLQIENNRATTFTAPRNGQSIDLPALSAAVRVAMLQGRSEVQIPISLLPPRVRLGDLNQLGIRELLTSGQSDFSGSTSARMQNIKVGASQYNGVIIKPGEEFSFNKNLGPIDAAHGYLPELVIKPEGLTKEFGGGLCQVATTAFRAAFFSGLPITQRRNHSYAVRYYEWISDSLPRVPGLDATIYPGAQDLKFFNDTPGAILIWTRIEGKRLHFDFYGTRDGREVIMNGPHPYDRKASGAVKSQVTRVIKQNGQLKEEKVFHSNYIPPKPIIQTIEYPKSTAENSSNPAVN